MTFPTSSRRQFVACLSSALALPPVPAKTRLILLGTGGGPRPRKNSYATSQVIVANNVGYVVDCGDGVATQLARAGVPLAAVRHVFLTHQHSDHNADYGNLLLLGWTAGLESRVDTWGPPPLARMTRLFFEMNDYDIRTRIADEGRPPLVPLVHVHELTQAGPVMRDENLEVKCALVNHPPVEPAFAYRFDASDRSIVISGDTNRCDALVRLAEGADVLVHEALYAPAVRRMPRPAALKEAIIRHHTPVEEVGRVAQAAGVKTLVLSHLVPADDPALTDQMWIDGARIAFKGRIILGKDLLEI